MLKSYGGQEASSWTCWINKEQGHQGVVLLVHQGTSCVEVPLSVGLLHQHVTERLRRCPRIALPCVPCFNTFILWSFFAADTGLCTSGDHERGLLAPSCHCLVLRCGYGSPNASLAFSMVSRSPCPPNLRPCLRTIHPIKYHSVSFSDVYIGEFGTLCPSLRHVHSKQRATDPEFIYANDGTKPSPSSVLDYFIDDNSWHYQQWCSDFETNKDFKKAEK